MIVSSVRFGRDIFGSEVGSVKTTHSPSGFWSGKTTRDASCQGRVNLEEMEGIWVAGEEHLGSGIRDSRITRQGIESDILRVETVSVDLSSLTRPSPRGDQRRIGYRYQLSWGRETRG